MVANLKLQKMHEKNKKSNRQQSLTINSTENQSILSGHHPKNRKIVIQSQRDTAAEYERITVWFPVSKIEIAKATLQKRGKTPTNWKSFRKSTLSYFVMVVDGKWIAHESTGVGQSAGHTHRSPQDWTSKM